MSQSNGQKIGFIGMGTMGGPMACNLVRKGFQVIVYNRSRDKCASAVAAGATLASSIAELVQASDVVWLMLAHDAAVKEVALRKDGLVTRARPGLLVVDSSTVHPDTSREVAAALDAKGAVFLDAPVTGSKLQAETGQLFFLVGGPREACDRAIPAFEAMGRRHLYLGGNGMGACAKLCNNLAAFINLAGFCEALWLGQRYGLDPNRLYDVIANSGGRSAMSELKGPKLLRGDWSTDFALALAHKDVALAQQLAAQLSRPLPVTTAVVEVFGAAKQTGAGESDVCALYQWYGQ